MAPAETTTSRPTETSYSCPSLEPLNLTPVATTDPLELLVVIDVACMSEGR